jgi:hypothetical protein
MNHGLAVISLEHSITCHLDISTCLNKTLACFEIDPTIDLNQGF